MYSHGITFGGHPVQCAIALKNIEIMKRERIVENVRDERRSRSARRWSSCSSFRSSATCAATGFFYAIELVKDKETRETFTDEECETLLRGFLSPRLLRAGAHLPRGRPRRPGVQISPPLIATQREFDEIAGTLGEALAAAWELIR